jgi:hypothetical protein
MVKKELDTGGLATHKNLNFYIKNLLHVDSILLNVHTVRRYNGIL